ncbi:MAG: SWIM zinc finger family protein [Verrucomicrobia bacterium]|nr:SWIM zinc finger family protein [Verrucomicrobiota bacterium]MDA1005035.1 SWIM zinc finger family protein [Verrucomicrobiota bacterium]
MRYEYWKPYVPVAARKAEARRQLLNLEKGGLKAQPVEIEGRKIAKSFWGAAWCDHLESFGDFANRIPRGRTYARNGSVCHLAIGKGQVIAMVSGSELYNVRVTIVPLAAQPWEKVKENCTGQVSSVLELLQGKLSASVMGIVTDQKTGLFPTPREISFDCDCPDYADMCKHIAAVLYGVGARLDHQPDLLFTLRGVDHQELITADVAVADNTPKIGGRRRISSAVLADVFGIELSEDRPTPRKPAKKAVKKTGKPSAKKPATTAVKKAATKKIAKRNVPKEKSVPKKSLKKAPQIRRAPDPLTGPSLAALRKKFAMTRIEFALLAGVSPLTVHHWEAKPGVLTLRKNSQEALGHLFKFTKRKAWQEMENL